MWMPERLKVWQVLFLVFPLLAWLAWSSYSDFTHLEEEGGVLYVGRTTKLLYDLGGKWAVVGFPVVLMGIWGYAIWRTLALSRRADALKVQAEAQERGEATAPAAATARPGARTAGAARPGAPSTAAATPPAEGRKPPRDSRPPTGPLAPLAAAPPQVTVRAEDAPPDPSGPKLLR